MISLDEALRRILAFAPRPVSVRRTPLENSLGCVLAETVRSDCDFPPFDRAMMDGYALRSVDTASAPVSLHVIGESRAGKPFRGSVGRGEAVGILTGAPVPSGADAVLQVEKVRSLGKNKVEIPEAIRSGRNVAHRGEDLHRGDTVLVPGVRLRPQDLTVLAAAGKDPVRVLPAPRVGVLATGDELVSPSRKPRFGQIRESNSYALEAQIRREGFPVRRFAIAPDDPARLLAAVRRALAESDCLLVSGGISVGRYDYVASVFRKLGLRERFHGVSIKPGKPVWFGTKGRRVAFGLPGNPVSSFVIFETLVKPCLRRMAGIAEIRTLQRGRFTGGSVSRNKRLQCHPAVVRETKSGVAVRALRWTSSGDFFELARANALLLVPPESLPSRGAPVQFLPI